MTFGKGYADKTVYKESGTFFELQSSYRWLCDGDPTRVRGNELPACPLCHPRLIHGWMWDRHGNRGCVDGWQRDC